MWMIGVKSDRASGPGLRSGHSLSDSVIFACHMKAKDYGGLGFHFLMFTFLNDIDSLGI